MIGIALPATQARNTCTARDLLGKSCRCDELFLEKLNHIFQVADEESQDGE